MSDTAALVVTVRAADQGAGADDGSSSATGTPVSRTLPATGVPGGVAAVALLLLLASAGLVALRRPPAGRSG